MLGRRWSYTHTFPTYEVHTLMLAPLALPSLTSPTILFPVVPGFWTQTRRCSRHGRRKPPKWKTRPKPPPPQPQGDLVPPNNWCCTASLVCTARGGSVSSYNQMSSEATMVRVTDRYQNQSPLPWDLSPEWHGRGGSILDYSRRGGYNYGCVVMFLGKREKRTSRSSGSTCWSRHRFRKSCLPRRTDTFESS